MGASFERDDGADLIGVLLDNHRAFLSYLERRVGDRALAEDILQDAFIKIVERPEQAPADQGIVPWFYRMLRNAAIDRFRRRGTAERAFEAFAREALKKRVAESCGTCAEHGCMNCTCRTQ